MFPFKHTHTSKHITQGKKDVFENLFQSSTDRTRSVTDPNGLILEKQSVIEFSALRMDWLRQSEPASQTHADQEVSAVFQSWEEAWESQGAVF